MSRRGVVWAHTVAAGVISLVTGWAGTGIVLCILTPMFLIRYVWFDREVTMAAATVSTAILATMGLSQHGTAGAVVVALGGFVGAELAARGARLRRAAPLPRLRGDLPPTVGVGLAAVAVTVATTLFTLWHPPAALSVAALAVLVTALFLVAFDRPAARRDAPTEPPATP